ncbi:MAG: Ig-like domain-containing protein [Planctomycetaceae bacterium]
MSHVFSLFDRGRNIRRFKARKGYKAAFLRAESLESRTLLTTLSWSSAPALPAPRTDAVALQGSNGAIYLLGGNSAAATDTPVLGTTATSWSTGVAIDFQRIDLGAVRIGNSLYLFGGTGGNEGSDEVLNYDYLTGDSQDLAKMNLVRYDHGFATDAEGRAYALGGIGVFADGEIWSEAERYDPATDTWSSIASMPQALHGHSAVNDGNGRVLVFGGSTTLDDSGIQRTVYSYDVASDTWSTVAPMIVGTRDSAVAVDHNGLIYVTGGMTTTGATDAVQTYDPMTNTWSSETALPAPVYSHAAAFDAAHRIIIAGGFDQSGTPTSAVYRTQDLSVPDVAPVISTSPVVSGSLDTFYTYDVNASGNPVPTFALTTAPAGMTIDEFTGVISWQPVAGQVGVHSVVVKAQNRAGTAEQSFDITVVADTIAPTTPTGFAFDSATQTSVTFTWNESTDAVGVDHYEVATAAYVGPRFGKHWVYTVIQTVPGDTTTATISDLAPLFTEDYAVRAVDAAGNVSAWTARVFATTLAPPTIAFSYGTQTSGTIVSPALTPITIRLSGTGNPTPTFSIVSGPAGMSVDATTGVVQWTPGVDDVGLNDVTFRAKNSEGTADLVVSIDVTSDAPQLSVQFGPSGGVIRSGTLFTADVIDSSNTPSTFSLVSAAAGLTLDGATGAIAWTPAGEQGGVNLVTVRGENAGGTTDLTFAVNVLFTGAVTGVTVTNLDLLEHTANWIAPTGEGSGLVASYHVRGFAEWGVGRTYTTHTVDYDVPASQTSVALAGLLIGKSYRLTITPLDAAGHPGVADNSATFVHRPALPIVSWTVDGSTGGLGVPGIAIAEQPVQVALTDSQTASSTFELISGPEGLTFDPSTNTANWTPTVDQVTTGYTTADVTFRATNYVGSVDVTVPIRVFFSGTVRHAFAQRNGYEASASWDPPIDNASPVVTYSITRYWTFQGSHQGSATYTVPGDVTSFDFVLGPTGAVVHTGIDITPVDEFGNFGVTTGRIAFGSYQNDLPPIAVDDAYDAIEDTLLSVPALSGGVLQNDIDTDNTPGASVLTAQLVSGPANGSLILGSTGSVSYTPNADFNGTDSFVYRVFDGRFYSENATVTISVAAVNDAPKALDDYYFATAGTSLPVDAAAGVLGNDFDVDGDAVIVSITRSPFNGSVNLNADGSFVYIPGPGFTGIDTFTYVASDGLLDSRESTVSIEVALPPTKFFVVDTDVESTFEYAEDGTLVDNYSLRGNNRASQGAAATSDGSTLFVVNANKRVFVYDDAGGYRGFWTALGPMRVDGIATDDTDIWILDRRLDMVFHYANAASLRSGEMEPTDSFALHVNNRNGTGITTDGTNIWVVNDIPGKDKVYKYDMEGKYVTRWNIDPVNSQPTGITIDPTGASNDIWIVDSLTDSVYQYNRGAARVGGNATADAVFALAPGNTNPQGIADPPPVGRVYSKPTTANPGFAKRAVAAPVRAIPAVTIPVSSPTSPLVPPRRHASERISVDDSAVTASVGDMGDDVGRPVRKTSFEWQSLMKTRTQSSLDANTAADNFPVFADVNAAVDSVFADDLLLNELL